MVVISSFSEFEAFTGKEIGVSDYLQITQGNYTFELVPVLAIDSFEQAENLMDMSPFHVHYVREHLNDVQRDDARLAKQFCKAAELRCSFTNGVPITQSPRPGGVHFRVNRRS